MFKLPKWNVDYFTTPDALNSFEPKWHIELQLITVPITHFAAMTMGCDGHIFDEDSINLSNKGKLAVKDDLSERLRVITNNLDAGRIPGCYKSNDKWECNLKHATQWAHANGWELPEPMLQLIGNIPKQETDNPVQPEVQSLVDSALQFDKASPTYPPELDWALQAWRAVSATESKDKPKARIKKWLDSNTKLSNEAKERIATVANWNKAGGATRTNLK